MLWHLLPSPWRHPARNATRRPARGEGGCTRTGGGERDQAGWRRGRCCHRAHLRLD
jgi:hypothetical protein